MIYDVRGNGKTAVKVTFNKYLRGQTLNNLGTDPNPVNTMVTTANRAWNDTNSNFVPDCVLLNLAANGECLGINNPLFGSAARSATFDDILRTGYGNREANWEFSAGVQHEVAAARLGRRRLLPPDLEELPRDRRPVARTALTSTPSA